MKVAFRGKRLEKGILEKLLIGIAMFGSSNIGVTQTKPINEIEKGLKFNEHNWNLIYYIKC